jgi:hypothetical protein
MGRWEPDLDYAGSGLIALIPHSGPMALSATELVEGGFWFCRVACRRSGQPFFPRCQRTSSFTTFKVPHKSGTCKFFVKAEEMATKGARARQASSELSHRRFERGDKPPPDRERKHGEAVPIHSASGSIQREPRPKVRGISAAIVVLLCEERDASRIGLGIPPTREILTIARN